MSSFLARRLPTASASLARSFSASARRDIAKMTIVGNLAATPEIKATSTGREILEYAVASNSGPRDKQTTSWFKVASFIEEGPRRDYLASLPKGTTVYVEGDAVMNSYEDAEGQKRSSLSIYQRDLQVLRRPREQSSE
ncbi:nucleic acid-binding protein [Xylariaceae sp. FL0016]|nr:nucleic acid-binding protein [Xylariaceae sp. FL0016]